MKKLTPYGIFIVVLASMFYVYDYLLQASPGVITNELLRDFNLNAESLGMMSACFFYAYAPTQLLGGVLYDRFGPHVILTIMSAVCAFGALAFALGGSIWHLSLGRSLMGFGSAFAFVGILILISRWLPQKYFATCAGLLQSLGSLGAIVGQVPIAWVVSQHGWRNCFELLFWFGLFLSIVLALCLRNWPVNMEHRKIERVVIRVSILTRLKIVFGKLQTYWIAIYSFAIWIPVTVFATLWGIPYIAALYHISVEEASTLGMMVWLGIAVGSPLFGIWSSKINLRCKPLSVSALLALATSLLALYVPMPLWMMYITLFIFGMGASGQTLIFAVVKENNPESAEGTAMGFNNLAVVAGGAICQPIAGYLVRLYSNGVFVNGEPYYSAQNYKAALILLPIFAIVAWIMSTFFIRETHGRSIVK